MVVAIIGLVASIVLVSVNTARIRSRDAVRRETLRRLQTALELYFDANRSYPNPAPCGSAYLSSEPGDPAAPQCGGSDGNWIPGLAPTYVSVLPRDPRGGVSTIPNCVPFGYKSAYTYTSQGDNLNYKLMAHCSAESTWGADDPFYDPLRPTWSWMVCSDEPACSTW